MGSSESMMSQTFPISMTCNMSYSPSRSRRSKSPQKLLPLARVKQYREKLKEDPEAWVNYKKKEAERKREARKKMTVDQRRRASEMAKLRRKRRLLNLALAGLGAQSEIPPTGSTGLVDLVASPGVDQSPGLSGDNAPNHSATSTSTDSIVSGTDADILQMLPPGLASQPLMETLLKERQREFWREEKRKYRARMSEQKRQQVRQHDAHYKRSRRQMMKETSEQWGMTNEPGSDSVFVKQEPSWMYDEDHGFSYQSYGPYPGFDDSGEASTEFTEGSIGGGCMEMPDDSHAMSKEVHYRHGNTQETEQNSHVTKGSVETDQNRMADEDTGERIQCQEAPQIIEENSDSTIEDY